MAGLKAGKSKAAKGSGGGSGKSKAGHWVTGDDGRKYFITGSGERLSGPSAYKAYKAQTGFVPGKKAPISSSDARVMALRKERATARPGIETDPDRPARLRREDKVLLKTPSEVPIEHHYGKPPPKYTKAEAETIKPVAKKYEAGKQLTPDEQVLAARYVDAKNGHKLPEGEHSVFFFDRLKGEYFNYADKDLRLSPMRAESFRSGRYEMLKAYDHTGVEVKIDAKIREKFSGGKGATRASNLKKLQSGFKAG